MSRPWDAKYEAKRQERYRQRREAGLCQGSLTCTEPAEERGCCRRHADMRRAHERKSNTRRYWARKLDGKCVTSGCPNTAQEDGVCCLPCATLLRAQKRSTRGLKKAARYRKRWRKERWRAGLCVACGAEPLLSKRYGESCLIRARERSRLRYIAKHQKAPGPTREDRAARDLGPIEAYLSTGTSNLGEAARPWRDG